MRGIAMPAPHAVTSPTPTRAISFELEGTDGAARAGKLHTTHGTVETPVFMAVGTRASVKGLTPAQLHEAGITMVLGNTYHLTLRPGDELIAELGGLHRFMDWPGPILTDSGGYQVYSLALCRKIDDRAVIFQSHLDGTMLELSPERAIAIQENLGSDIAMCLDECPPAGCSAEELAAAVQRTIGWAERCRRAQRRPDQALFAIVQGSTDNSLRAECARALVALDFPGYALGGFSVGESSAEMLAGLKPSADLLPEDRPRYLMGVGRPEDLIEAVAAGIDMFDCVLPTRNGRNACAFVGEGVLRLRNARHRRDPAPLESDCECYTCRHYSRAYLHHLFQADEMLGPVLLSLHNLAHYARLMREMRQAIMSRQFAQYCTVCLARWQRSP
jgi:queuine tRNA-ribosyltransferase